MIVEEPVPDELRLAAELPLDPPDDETPLELSEYTAEVAIDYLQQIIDGSYVSVQLHSGLFPVPQAFNWHDVRCVEASQLRKIVELLKKNQTQG